MGSSKASPWTPAPRRRPTGRCSTAPGPSGCTTGPTTTVSGLLSFSRRASNVCQHSRVSIRSLPPSPAGPGGGGAGVGRLLLHPRQPERLQPVGQLLAERALRRNRARAGHQVPESLRVAVHPRGPLQRRRPEPADGPRHHTQQLTVRAPVVGRVAFELCRPCATPTRSHVFTPDCYRTGSSST